MVERKTNQLNVKGEESTVDVSPGVEILEEAAVPAKVKETEEIKAESPKPTKKPKKESPKKGISKRFQALTKKVEDRPYPLDEALKLVKDNATAKFDETIEAHIRLGIDPTQTSQAVRGSAQLPHGTGQTVRVLAFATGADAEAAKKAGATVATEETIAQIEKGSIPFDLVIATPAEMPNIAKLARVLGVRGLMPNPKTGTITTDIAGTISARSQGLVDFKNESSLLHLRLGKASMTGGDLKENFEALLSAVKAARPAKTSGEFIRTVTLKSTMGPAVSLDPKTL